MIWLSPKLSVTPKDKDWVEDSLLWMVGEFGGEFLLQPELIFNEDHFPEFFEGGNRKVSYLSSVVCEKMGIDPDSIFIDYFTEQSTLKVDRALHVSNEDSVSLGLYHHKLREGRHRISLNKTLLTDLEGLISTLSHELGHVRLLGEGRLQHDDEHHELLTDLLMIFFGLGVFKLNNAFERKAFSDGDGWTGWSMQTRGYLPPEVICYALAIRLYVRGKDASKDWLDFTDRGMRKIILRNLLYLEKKGTIRSELQALRA